MKKKQATPPARAETPWTGVPVLDGASPSQPVPQLVGQTATSKWFAAGEQLSGSVAMPTVQTRASSWSIGVGVAGVVVAIAAVWWARGAVAEARGELVAARAAQSGNNATDAIATNSNPTPPAVPAAPTVTATTLAAPTATATTTATTPTTTATTPTTTTTTPTTPPTTAPSTAATPTPTATTPPTARTRTETRPTAIATKAPTATQTTTSPTSARGASRPSTRSDEVEIILYSTPPGALVTTSTDRTLGKTPLIAKFPRGKAVTLYFKHEGMEPASRNIRPSGDATMDITLRASQ